MKYFHSIHTQDFVDAELYVDHILLPRRIYIGSNQG